MTNLNYLLISGPLKRNMSITNDLSSSFMGGVLFSDSDDKSTPRLQWVYICSSWGGLHLCCSAMFSWCPAHVHCCCRAESGHAASVPSCWTLFCCRSTSDTQEFLAGVSSAAPPKLQDSGTSAMQKSIYSQSYKSERARRDRDSE